MGSYNVNFPPFRDMVNEPFAGLWKNKRRIKLLWGGRGSGKSIAAIRLLILRALVLPYFKCICVRKVYDTCKESQWEAIRDEIEKMGLSDLFIFRVQPLDICVKHNRNRFLFRGLDKPDKLKGIKEPTHAWYEEGSQISREDWITVSTCLRSGTKKTRLEEIFTFNPETNGEQYEEFWIYKDLLAGHTKNTFDSAIEVENPVTGDPMRLEYSSIWSDYTCNPHLPPEFITFLESLRKVDPYYYTIYALGQWGNKPAGYQFYKTFSMDLVGFAEYIPSLPLHVTLDENVNPYLTFLVWQVRQRGDDLQLWQIDEICLPHPKNTLRATCDEFKRKYKGHTEGVYIYGDRTSIKADVKLEKGQNFFTLVETELSEFNPQRRLPSQNPNVKSRGEFINSIFAGSDPNVKITISGECKNTITDYQNVVEAADGSKVKKKVKDKQSGMTFEQFGHCSDANDYFLIELLKDKYLQYINGGVTSVFSTGRRNPYRGRKNQTI